MSSVIIVIEAIIRRIGLRVRIVVNRFVVDGAVVWAAGCRQFRVPNSRPIVGRSRGRHTIVLITERGKHPVVSVSVIAVVEVRIERSVASNVMVIIYVVVVVVVVIVIGRW